MEVEYTQIIFHTPQARIDYAEASVELLAERVVNIYRGLAGDANDGEFALWTQYDLIGAIVALDGELSELNRARDAAK